MTVVFLKLLNRSIAAGWIALAVIPLRLLLKKMPKQFTCMLWTLVGLRLILPFSFESIFSLIPSARTIPGTLSAGAFPEISSGIAPLDRVVNPAAKISFSFLSSGRSGAEALGIATKCIVFIWLAGICLMLFYLIFSYLHLQKKMRTAVLLKDNIWQSEFSGSPFILGLINPRIYIPYHLSEEVLSHVIAHENAHLARKDHLVKAFAFILLSICWFHPLLWIAYILLCRDIELACDEKVIRNMEEEQRKSYLFALIGYHKEDDGKKIPALSCPLSFGEADLKKRILRAKTWKKPAPVPVLLTLLLCAMAALCFLTNPKEKPLTAQESASSSDALYSHRTKYVGNNSAVGNIIYNLAFPQEMTYQQFSLQTDDSEPYGVTITFALSGENKEQYAMDAANRQKEIALLRQNACIMFSLIENAEIVNFQLVDETDEAKRPLTLVYTRQWAQYETGCSLWAMSDTKEQFESLLLNLEELFHSNMQ